MGFEKGKSGNPAGRPKNGKSISSILKAIGDETVEVKDEDGNVLREVSRLWRIMEITFEWAERGEAWAIKFIAERTEGRVAPAKTSTEKQYDDVEFLQ